MFGDEVPEKGPRDEELEDEEKPERDEDEDEDEDEEKSDKDEKGEKKPEEDEEGEGEDRDKKPEKAELLLMSKKKCCKNCNKSKKKMTKENKDWYGSVMDQLNSDPNAKFWDGFTTIEEDALLPPQDQNAGLVDGAFDPNQVKPGVVGYAPVQRVGGWFS